jgi:hypothetical protein
MKKSDIRFLKTLVIPIGEEIAVPSGWEIIKEPTKITINGVDCFQAVIGKN